MGRGRIFIELTLRGISPPIAVGRAASRDELAALYPSDSTPDRALCKLFSLNLGSKRLGTPNKLADARVFESFRYEFESSSRLSKFLCEDGNMCLFA
jgi:hypothetical protein